MSKDDKIKLDGIEEQANAYVLPFAEDTVLGGVKLREELDPSPADTRVGLELDNGVLSVKGLLASQIFISPSPSDDKRQSDFNTDIVNQVESKADAVHTHDVATQNTNGFLSKEDKVKLDGIAEGANKTIVDSSLSSTSVNPVQSKIINSALNGKANVSHTHSIGDVSNLQSALDGKANTSHTHEDATISKSGFMSASDKSKLDSLNESGNITIDTSLSLTSENPVSNGVITQALNEKANVSHTHSIGDISNLQSTLNKKANTTHTHSDIYYTKNEIDTRLGDIETILNEILGV